MSAIQFLTTVSRSVKASLFQNADTMQQVGRHTGRLNVVCPSGHLPGFSRGCFGVVRGHRHAAVQLTSPAPACTSSSCLLPLPREAA